MAIRRFRTAPGAAPAISSVGIVLGPGPAAADDTAAGTTAIYQATFAKDPAGDR